MQPCTKCFGQCSCFVDVHFVTLTGVFRHDQVRSCGARDLCVDWVREIEGSRVIRLSKNVAKIVFWREFASVTFYRQTAVTVGSIFIVLTQYMLLKNTPPFLLWIGSVCLSLCIVFSSEDSWAGRKNGFHFENLWAKSKALRQPTQLQNHTGVIQRMTSMPEHAASLLYKLMPTELPCWLRYVLIVDTATCR